MRNVIRKLILVIFIQILLFSTWCVRLANHHTKNILDRVKVADIKNRFKEELQVVKGFSCQNNSDIIYIEGLLKKDNVIAASKEAGRSYDNENNITYLKEKPKCIISNTYKVVLNKNSKGKWSKDFIVYENDMDKEKQSITYVDIAQEHSFKNNSPTGQELLKVMNQENVEFYFIDDSIYIDTYDFKDKVLKVLPGTGEVLMTNELERIREVVFESGMNRDNETMYYFREGLPIQTFSKNSNIGKFLLNIDNTLGDITYKTYLHKKDIYFEMIPKGKSLNSTTDYKFSVITSDGKIKKNLDTLPIGAEKMSESTIIIKDKEIKLRVSGYSDRVLINPNQAIINFGDEIQTGKKTAHLKYDSNLKEYIIYLAPKNKNSQEKVVVVTDNDSYHFVDKLPVNSFKPNNQLLWSITPSEDSVKLTYYKKKTISADYVDVIDYKKFYFNQIFVIGGYPTILIVDTLFVLVTLPITIPWAYVIVGLTALNGEEAFDSIYGID